jgi:hypothetical protein
VERPGRARHRTRPALSWSCAALRGLRPRPTRTDMGSVRPARRFDARRALASRDLPSRIAPDGGPPCAFALLQRSIAAPPHRPAGPKADPSDDASSPGLLRPYDTCRNGGPAFRGASRPRCVPRAGFGYPHRGVHHRPCRRLAAPERPSASPLKAFSSRRSDRLSAAPALLALLASVRLAPQGGVRTRSTPGPRSRREFVLATGSRRTRCVDAFSGLHPPEHSPPPACAPALGRRASPLTRWMV